MASRSREDETEYEPQQAPEFWQPSSEEGGEASRPDSASSAPAEPQKAVMLQPGPAFQPGAAQRQPASSQPAARQKPAPSQPPAEEPPATQPAPEQRSRDIKARPAQRTTDRQVIDDAAMKDLMRDERSSSLLDLLDEYWYCLATIALIAVNVVVFAVEFVQSGFSADISSEVLVNMGAMYAPFIDSPADLYRFITPMFLHMDPLHLLLNMVALYSVGETLEYVLGKANFLLLYFVSGITGNAVSYMADVLFGTGYTVSAGASTSVFGLFVAVALLAVLCRGNRQELVEYSKGMLGVIGVNLVYTLLVPGISVSGHMGGAVGGLIAMFMLPSENLRVPNAVRIVVAVAWAAALGYVLMQTGVLA